MVLNPSITAANTIKVVPTTTLLMFLPLAPSSSRNSTLPQNSPISAFAFHIGNATASPTSRIAKTVSVFATAHSAPASSAHTIRCFFSARSAKTYPVPFSRVGNVQRAVNTPATIQSEIANGENPAFTSFVGASAAPSHTPAVNPQITPSPCSDNPVFSARCTVPGICVTPCPSFSSLPLLSSSARRPIERSRPPRLKTAPENGYPLRCSLPLWHDSCPFLRPKTACSKR